MAIRGFAPKPKLVSAPSPAIVGGRSKFVLAGTELAETMASIAERFGNEVGQLQSARKVYYDRIRTGAFSLDLALSGGFLTSRGSMLYGERSCLSGETKINYHVRNADGTTANTKGGSLHDLYLRFNKLQNGKGRYQRPATVNAYYTAPSMDDDGHIFHNRISGVVDAGIQECFEMVTASGYRIVATGKHKFNNGQKYVALSTLKVGDTLLVHNNTYLRPGRNWSGTRRKYLYLRYHPVGGIKYIENGTYAYYRVARARAVMEAHINGLGLSDFIKKLNRRDTAGLTFLTREQHVHHLDENVTNDAFTNLQVMSNKEHSEHHSETRTAPTFIAVTDEIVSIVSVGKQHVYDIIMAAPFNNFVADKFVVHNSGKSTLAAMTCVNAQRMYPDKVCVWIDVEGTFDIEWFIKLGGDPGRLYLLEPTSGEEAVDMADAMCRTKETSVIVTDSIAMLVPMKEIEVSAEADQVGLHARLTGKYLRKLNAGMLMERHRGHRILILHINQFRMKIGVAFGDPRTLPGGKALEFCTSQQVEMRNKENISEKGDIKFNEHTFKITKDKTGGRIREGTFRLVRDPDYNDGMPEGTIYQIKSMHEMACRIGLAEGRMDFKEFGKWNKAEDAQLALLADPEKYVALQEAILSGYRRKWGLATMDD